MKHEDKKQPPQEEPGDLAIFLATLPYRLYKHLNLILLIATLAVGGWSANRWYKTRQEIKLQEACSELALAGQPFPGTPAKYDLIIRQYPIPSIQAQAYAQIGQFYLIYLESGTPADGLNGVKTTAQKAEDAAATAFNQILSRFGEEYLPVAKARMGLAILAENHGQWDLAAEQYRQLINGRYAKTAFATEAQRRIDQLELIKKPVAFALAPLPSTTQSKAAK